jgi:ParB family chromosome partitioning protein
MVGAGQLSMGHARALITAPDPEALAEEVVRRGLSVRETEKLAKAGKARRSRAAPISKGQADIAALERQLGDLLGLKISIRHGASGGSVTLAYSTLDQLDMICQRLSGDKF